MERPTRRKRVLLIGLATSLLAASTMLAGGSSYRLILGVRRAARVAEVLATLDASASRLGAAGLDHRAFVLRGDPSDLARYRESAVEVVRRLERLAWLVVGDPGQAARLDRLRPLVAARLLEMGRAIEARRRGEAGAAPAIPEEGPAWAEGRAVFEEMKGAARRELDRLGGASEAGVRVAWLALATLALTVLGLLGAAWWAIRSDLSGRSEVVEALRQSRERFELAVIGSRDGLWDWDLDRDRVYFSPRWKAMLGYHDRDVGDRLDEFSTRVHPDDADRVSSTIESYLASRLDDYEQEVRLRHKDGSYRWILTRGVALRDDRGRAYRMAGSHTDITARKRAEELLSMQNRRLEDAARCSREAHDALMLAQSRLVQSEKLAGLGQMVAGVAHEINNPLAFVINNAAVLGRDVGDLRTLVDFYARADPLIALEDPDLARRIAGFREEVEMDYLLDNIRGLLRRSDDGLKRIQRVVKDLRLFARLDEGDIQEADLNAGVESTLTIIRGNARRDDVELAVDLGEIPPVTCYSAKINQVIMNLLSNAVDACDPGGVVTVRTRAVGESVRIEVADTGSGIDPAIRERIFDPFFTTKPVGQGTGLGLSISYGIIQDHGGTIEVSSEPGQGTTFTVTLPRNPPVDAAAPLPA